MTEFKNLGIREDILKAINDLGFNAPTPIQNEIIPRMLRENRDLIGLAQTGTGKTAAFGIPLIQSVDAGRRATQAVVLCPTRELCVQVAKDLTSLSRYVAHLNVLAIYGGSSMEQQIRSLARGAQVIIATPGRLQDLIQRGKVDLSGIRLLVLDEADEMLQMGFQEELDAILDTTPENKNTLLFSATMPKGVSTLASKYMRKVEEITVGNRNAGAENVKHCYCACKPKERYQVLKRIIDFHPELYAIVFCRTRQETKDVADFLLADGYNADALHGDLSQAQRDGVMQKFRRRNLQLLVATDVAARGLDVQELTHVINYNLPDDTAIYTHRSGRTGRAGRTGISLSITLLRDLRRIREYENCLKRKFEKIAVPDGMQICRKRLESLLDTACNTEPHRQLGPLLSSMQDRLASLDREELLKRLIALQFNDTLKYYDKAVDLKAPTVKDEKVVAKTRLKRVREKKAPSFTRLQINVGKKDGLHPARLIGEINELSAGLRVRFGRIDINDRCSYIETESRFAPHVIDIFRQRIINGRPVTVQIAGEEKNAAPVPHARISNKSAKAHKKQKKYGKNLPEV